MVERENTIVDSERPSTLGDFSNDSFALHSRSARYNCRQLDDVKRDVVQVLLHEVEFLYSATFHSGLKIATPCFIRDQLDASAVAWTWQ